MSEGIVSGVCRICHCTDLSPCVISSEFTLDDPEGRTVETCSWLDPEHTLCTNFDCVAVVPLDELVDIVLRGKARAVAGR